MSPKTESPTSLLIPPFDPWVGAAEVHTQSAAPEAPPLHWNEMTAASRERIGGALVYIVGLLPGAGRGDVGVLVARTQQALRATHTEELGETGPPVALVLAGLYVRDGEERKRWRQAEVELARIGSGGGGVLREAAAKLVAVGDLAFTLTERRREIDRALDRLARLRAR